MEGDAISDNAVMVEPELGNNEAEAALVDCSRVGEAESGDVGVDVETEQILGAKEVEAELVDGS